MKGSALDDTAHMTITASCRLVPPVLIWSLLAMIPSFSVSAALFFGLGDLPGSRVDSTANGISSDGSTIIGGSYSASGYQAFRWTISDGMQGLGYLPGSSHSVGTGASAGGAGVVGWSITSAPEAFRWTSSGGLVGLGTLSPGDVASYAYGSSANGTVVVGGNQYSQNAQAFIWTEGRGMVGIGDLPGGELDSTAFAVTPDGAVVVGHGTSATGMEAFRWTADGGMRGLGDLPGERFFSSARAVSADGRVVVGFGYSASGQEAFRWTAGGGMQGLGDFSDGAFGSVALGANEDGSVIVGWGMTADGNRAMIWDATNGLRRIESLLTESGVDLAGWTLRSADGISADGQVIFGNGIHNGNAEGWVVAIPEPSISTLLAVAAIGVCIRAANRKLRIRDA